MFVESIEHLIKKTVFDALNNQNEYSILVEENLDLLTDYVKYCIPEGCLQKVEEHTCFLVNGSKIFVKEDVAKKKLKEAQEKMNQKTIKEIAESGEGIKDTEGKPDWSLVDLKNLEGLVRGLEYGAKKYSRDNWKKVPDPINTYYAATVRHLSEWWSGEEIDKESHLNHLYHVMCNIYFLTYFTEHAEDVVKE